MTKQMTKICLLLTTLLIVVSIYALTYDNKNLFNEESAKGPASTAVQSEAVETEVSPAESTTVPEPDEAEKAVAAEATAPAPKADNTPSLNTAPAPAEPSKPTEQPAPATNAETTTKATAPIATAVPSAEYGTMEQQVVALVNKERAANGLAELNVNYSLAGVAETKAEDLRDQNYFAHQSPTYGSPFEMMEQFSIRFSTAGENLARGQRTPEEVVEDWMESPGHKANILNSDYTEIGVGYVKANNGYAYWVQHFIRP